MREYPRSTKKVRASGVFKAEIQMLTKGAAVLLKTRKGSIILSPRMTDRGPKYKVTVLLQREDGASNGFRLNHL